MATALKYQCLVEDLAEKLHNVSTDVLKLILSNTAPDLAADAVLADAAEIVAGNGYTSGGHTVTVTASSQTAGVYKLICDDVTITASGGAIAQFRYAILRNSSANRLMLAWDYGSALTPVAGQFFKWDLSPTNGVLQLT